MTKERDLKKFLKKLAAIVGKDNLLVSAEERQVYSYDAKISGRPPLAVARPNSTEQVRRIMAACHQHRLPVIPRGAGTGTVGGAVPESDLIVLELVRMNHILEISSEEMLARVQPGVITATLDKEAGKQGLMYAPDPASSDICTLGGNVATNAGGLRAVRYGVTKHHVLALEVVLADGSLIHTGVRTRKGVVGLDLTELFVGSEGTLGIITEITLRLLPKPESKKTLVALFDTLEDAGRCVNAILLAGLNPIVMELMDRQTLEAARRENPDAPDYRDNCLLIETAGPESVAAAEAAKIEEICNTIGALRVERATTEAESKKLWAARRSISPALYKIRPKKIAEDVTVPVPKLAQMIQALGQIAERRNLLWAAYGHAGDGNLHANLLYDPQDEKETKAAKEARSEIFDAVLAMGGTISGEHGIGQAKRDIIGRELSPKSIEVQKAIKLALDPLNLLNPGKVYPAD